MYKKVFVINIIFLYFVFSKVNADENIWLNFINNPNKTNYEICLKDLNDSLSTNQYLKDNTPAFLSLTKNGVLEKIFRLIENGNIYASQLCLDFYPLFQGYPNYTERFGIPFGKLLKIDPESFLSLLNSYYNKDDPYVKNLNRFLSSYGDEFVDRPHNMLKETQERIEALKSVQNENLKNIKIKCIKSLEEDSAFYKRIINELYNNQNG